MMHTRQLAKDKNKYQVSYKYSYSSWWWSWRGPKHVEVINKIDEIYWEFVHQVCFIYKINYYETLGKGVGTNRKTPKYSERNLS